MNSLLCAAAVGLGSLIVLVLVAGLGAARTSALLKRSSPAYSERSRAASPGLYPRTGEGQDRDSTPYGAIGDLFADADGEGD